MGVKDPTKATVMYCADCAKVGCSDPEHDRFDADIMIVPILKVLHKKGYKTYVCCAGHPTTSHEQYNTHIAFTQPYPPMKAPEGFKWMNFGSVRTIGTPPPKHWMRIPFTQIRATIMVNRNLLKLYQWAQMLPPAHKMRQL